MTIPAIPAISAITPSSGVTAPTGVPSATGDGGFGASLAGAVNGLQQMQSTSDQLNIQAVTGNLNDIQDATVAAARVSTEIQLFATIKTQAVDSLNQILRMEG